MMTFSMLVRVIATALPAHPAAAMRPVCVTRLLAAMPWGVPNLLRRRSIAQLLAFMRSPDLLALWDRSG